MNASSERLGPIPPSPEEAIDGGAAEPDPVAVLGALGAALDAGEEAIAVVERRGRRLLWCGARCADVRADLVNGAVLGASDVLGALLDTGVRTHAPRAVDVGDHRATLAHLDERHAVLRFSPAAPPDDYVGRYVAEREKLFMVSRNVSLGEMATTLAHELNQPIGTIANLVQALRVVLARGGALPEDVERLLVRAGDQTRFAAGIIARIRSFTGSRAPRLIECDAAALVADTIELLDWVFRSEGVVVHLERPAEPLLVAGDRILLQQVFANLLRNAVDAMRVRPRDVRSIDVVVERDPDGVVVDVSDTGEGLGDGAVDAPFVPFLTSKGDGMGVGLNICRSFIEMHRGKLWLMPSPSGGCTARVVLPPRAETGGETA